MLVNLVLLLTFMTAAVQCQPNEWNCITPLKSTRGDVERILGQPGGNSKEKHAASYPTKWGKVFVLYSTGPCSVKPSHGWNVPELTVISMSVYPQPEPDFDISKINLNKFEKRPDPGSLSEVAYTNEEDGVSLTVNTWDQVVTRYHYFPESRYDYLKCKAD
jgi:hypothetical protein